MQVILVEKRREAGLRDQTPSRAGNSASTARTVSPPLTPQAPMRQSPDPVAGKILQRPFTLVRLAGDAGAGQSKSGLLWYWPFAGILWGLLYSGVAMRRYRPIERAAQRELPVLNESWFSRRLSATEPSVELGLSKKGPSSQEEAIIEAALTECAGRVSGRPTVALQALWALRTFLDVSGAVTPASPLPPCKMSDSTTSLTGCGNSSDRSSAPSTIEKMAVVAPITSASISTAGAVKPGDFSK
jgi:hypothetical protein